MLTEEASRERRWGRFPALRQALETRRMPAEFFGITSASDNMFERFRHLLETSVLVSAYRTEILETAQAVGPHHVYEDLRSLEDELRAVAHCVMTAIDEVRTVYGLL